MSEMNKKHDGSRTVRALKVSLVVSLVTALASWASQVVAGPPPGSTAVTFYMCVHNGSFLRSVMVFGVERGQVVPNEYNFFSFNSDDPDRVIQFETSPAVLADIHQDSSVPGGFFWTPKPVTLHCATSDGCTIAFSCGDFARCGLEFFAFVFRPTQFKEIDEGPNFLQDPKDLVVINQPSPPSKCRDSPK
jgi:hypothetical protein